MLCSPWFVHVHVLLFTFTQHPDTTVVGLHTCNCYAGILHII